jgi:hypothetical protein
MSKKKISKQEKRERRLKELQLAAAGTNVGYRIVKPEIDSGAKAKSAEVSSRIVDTQALPIKEIKKDLWNNAFYAVFSVAVVLILKATGFGLSFLSLHQ